MYSIRTKYSEEPELKNLINYVDKEKMFSKEAVEQCLDKIYVNVDK